MSLHKDTPGHHSAAVVLFVVKTKACLIITPPSENVRHAKSVRKSESNLHLTEEDGDANETEDSC